MKSKICGIRTPEEALNTARLHPGAIGILVGFDKAIAPNVVSEEQAHSIVEALHTQPYNIDTFLLTDKDDPETNIHFAETVGSSHIQLLGDVTPEGIRRIKETLPELKIVKVIHIIGLESIEVAKQYEATNNLDALLLDSRVGRVRGGTGKTHDWSISEEIARESHLPVWLAGGLRISNLKGAMKKVKPYGVDVETGVQNLDGSKNYELIGEFIQIAEGTLNGNIERLL
jgi:phosphoribosylanthranilate isomerase